jgi:hypothetical protein
MNMEQVRSRVAKRAENEKGGGMKLFASDNVGKEKRLVNRINLRLQLAQSAALTFARGAQDTNSKEARSSVLHALWN